MEAVAEVNENWGADAVLVDGNIVGELVEATVVVDVPNENPDEDELNEELNGDLLLGCQLEVPNKVELGPLLELLELTAEEEAGAPSPKVVPELKIFVVELEGNNEFPEEKDVFVAELEEGNKELPEEKTVWPVNPNNGDGADDWTDWVWVEAPNPLAGEAWEPNKEPLPEPKELWDWLVTVVIAEELNPKMELPVLPTAADELPNALLLRLPIPASWLLLVSSGSEPDDDTDKPVDVKGEDPNLKNEVVEDEVAITGAKEGELLLLNAIEAGVVTLTPVEAAVVAERDELLLLKLFDMRDGIEEENEGPEARDPLFWFELWPNLNILFGGVNSDVDAADETASSDSLTENPVFVLVSASPLSESRAFCIESVAPTTVVKLQTEQTFSTSMIVTLNSCYKYLNQVFSDNFDCKTH